MREEERGRLENKKQRNRTNEKRKVKRTEEKVCKNMAKKKM